MPRNTLFEYAEDIMNSGGFTRMPRQLAIDLSADVELYNRVCEHIGGIDEEIRTLTRAALNTVSELDAKVMALKVVHEFKWTRTKDALPKDLGPSSQAVKLMIAVDSQIEGVAPFVREGFYRHRQWYWGDRMPVDQPVIAWAEFPEAPKL